jgi:hypothetical protein
MEWIWQIGAMTIISVIGVLLRNKDQAQAEQIAMLFKKHDDDVAALQELRLQIANNHYVKHELDLRFDKLEATFTRGFDELGKALRDLGVRFDRLSDRLVESNADGRLFQHPRK